MGEQLKGIVGLVDGNVGGKENEELANVLCMDFMEIIAWIYF